MLVENPGYFYSKLRNQSFKFYLFFMINIGFLGVLPLCEDNLMNFGFNWHSNETWQILSTFSRTVWPCAKDFPSHPSSHSSLARLALHWRTSGWIAPKVPVKISNASVKHCLERAKFSKWRKKRPCFDRIRSKCWVICTTSFTNNRHKLGEIAADEVKITFRVDKGECRPQSPQLWLRSLTESLY